eukprot:jgi/Mesvir1/3332/Mv13717-RA.1
MLCARLVDCRALDTMHQGAAAVARGAADPRRPATKLATINTGRSIPASSTCFCLAAIADRLRAPSVTMASSVAFMPAMAGVASKQSRGQVTLKPTASVRSFASKSSSMSGDQTGLQMDRGRARVECRKKGIHPEWHDEAQVICNGEVVMKVGGVKPTYTVDIWSGNHPFFQKTTTVLLTDEGRVNRFKRQFGQLAFLGDLEASAGGKAAKMEPVAKKVKGGKKK